MKGKLLGITQAILLALVILAGVAAVAVNLLFNYNLIFGHFMTSIQEIGIHRWPVILARKPNHK